MKLWRLTTQYGTSYRNAVFPKVVTASRRTCVAMSELETKKVDRLTVLKCLSSTVGEDESLPDLKFLHDPFLSPKVEAKLMRNYSGESS